MKCNDWLIVLLSLSLFLTAPVEAKRLTASASVAPLSGNVAIDFDQPAAETGSLVTVKRRDCTIKHLKNIDCEFTGSRSMQLGTGEMVIYCLLECKFKLGEYTLEIQPNTYVMITNENNILVVRNLCQKTERAVTLVDLETRRASVDAGSEFIIGASEQLLQDLHDNQTPGMRMEWLCGNRRVISRIIPYASFNSSPLLTTIVKSGGKHDCALSKTVAALAADRQESMSRYDLESRWSE